VLREYEVRLCVIGHLESELVEKLIPLVEGADGLSRADVDILLASQQWGRAGRVENCLRRVLQIPSAYADPAPERLPSRFTVREFHPLPALFDFQEELAVGAGEMLIGGSSCLVHLPTGAGKTRTAARVVVDHILRCETNSQPRGVLWLAHSQELCEQAVNAFAQCWENWGAGPHEVGRAWGSYSAQGDVITHGFTVASYRKALNQLLGERGEPVAALEGVSLVVVDEAHFAGALQLRGFLQKLLEDGSRQLLGLTATPLRTADLPETGNTLTDLFDGNLVQADSLGPRPIQELQRRGILSAVQRVPVEGDQGRTTSPSLDAGVPYEWKDYGGRFLRILAEDGARNNAICDLVVGLVAEGHRVLCFCCSVEHAQHLALECTIRGCPSAFVDYRQRKSRRLEVVDNYSCGRTSALFNFGVLATGFDVPSVDSIVIARPTKSRILYSQMIGRGVRGSAVGGTPLCKVYDVDENLNRFAGLEELFGSFSASWK